MGRSFPIGLAIAFAGGCAVSVGPGHPTPGTVPELRAVHARMTVERGEDFVSVEPAGDGVRVRAVHVLTSNNWCPLTVVEAMERVLPATTVQTVVGVPVCDVSDAEVRRAVAKAPDFRGYVDFRGRIDAVVADCGERERGFAFVMPPVIDVAKLQRQSPRVAAIKGLGTRLRALVTGGAPDAYDPFEGMSAADRPTREALGTALVPELLRGPYSEVLTPRLTGYTQAPARRHPNFVEVVGLEAFPLETFVEPVMPQIAASARVFGDVRVAVTADPVTGRVTEAMVLDGPPLLRQAAADAISRWRYRPTGVLVAPPVVTVRFREPACTPEPAAGPR
jgi:hypothetical protein